jgi:hypothetical protein
MLILGLVVSLRESPYARFPRASPTIAIPSIQASSACCREVSRDPLRKELGCAVRPGPPQATVRPHDIR